MHTCSHMPLAYLPIHPLAAWPPAYPCVYTHLFELAHVCVQMLRFIIPDIIQEKTVKEMLGAMTIADYQALPQARLRTCACSHAHPISLKGLQHTSVV